MKVKDLNVHEQTVKSVCDRISSVLDDFQVPDDSEGYSFRNVSGLSSPHDCAVAYRDELEKIQKDLYTAYPRVALTK